MVTPGAGCQKSRGQAAGNRLVSHTQKNCPLGFSNQQMAGTVVGNKQRVTISGRANRQGLGKVQRQKTGVARSKPGNKSGNKCQNLIDKVYVNQLVALMIQ